MLAPGFSFFKCNIQTVHQCRAQWPSIPFPFLAETLRFRPTQTTQTNKQIFKVRQPQRAAKSKRPNAPADGSKNNGIHTTKQEEYPSRHPTTDTANSSTSKQSTSRRLMGVSKSNTIQSTNQAGGPVSPPHMYHPRRPAYQPRLIPKHVAI